MPVYEKVKQCFSISFFCKRWKKKNTFFELKIPSLFFWTFFRVRMLSDDIFRIPEKKKKTFFQNFKNIFISNKKEDFYINIYIFFPQIFVCATSGNPANVTTEIFLFYY